MSKKHKDALRGLLRQVEEIAENHDVMKKDFLEALWETYFVTRENEDLAIFIDAGGEFDEVTRQAVLRALRGEDKPLHGNSDVMDDIKFFTLVKKKQAVAGLERAIQERAMQETATKTTWRSKTKNRKKKPSLEDIFEELAPARSLTARGAKDKYDRGRKAARERLGIG